VIKKLGNPMRVDEVIAVTKIIDFYPGTSKPYGNRVELLSTRYLVEKAPTINSNQSGELIVIQKFVRPIGPYAFVCRCVWRKHKPPYTWVITNKVAFKDDSSGLTHYDRYVTRVNLPMHCSLVKAKGEQ
jgi:hypothetical protein